MPIVGRLRRLHLPGVRVTGVVVDTPTELVVGVVSVKKLSECPHCGCSCQKVHDRRQRGACIHVCVRWVFDYCGWCESWPERRCFYVFKIEFLGSGFSLAGLGGLGCWWWVLEESVEVAGDVSFEAAAGFSGGFSLAGSFGDVGLGFGAFPGAGNSDGVDGAVELAVAVAA